MRDESRGTFEFGIARALELRFRLPAGCIVPTRVLPRFRRRQVVHSRAILSHIEIRRILITLA